MDTERNLEAAAEKVLASARRLPEGKRHLIAIDGRAASGKSSLAALIAPHLESVIVHADDFYLHPGQRTRERYSTPGGNLDYERLRAEVIDPWIRDGAFVLRPYDAHRDVYLPAQEIAGGSFLIVEGSYSTHPALQDAYDLRIFLSTDPATQLERIARRNGPAAVQMFAEKWIPLEELYFSACDTARQSDLEIVT